MSRDMHTRTQICTHAHKGVSIVISKEVRRAYDIAKVKGYAGSLSQFLDEAVEALMEARIIEEFMEMKSR